MSTHIGDHLQPCALIGLYTDYKFKHALPTSERIASRPCLIGEDDGFWQRPWSVGSSQAQMAPRQCAHTHAIPPVEVAIRCTRAYTVANCLRLNPLSLDSFAIVDERAAWSVDHGVPNPLPCLFDCNLLDQPWLRLPMIRYPAAYRTTAHTSSATGHVCEPEPHPTRRSFHSVV